VKEDTMNKWKRTVAIVVVLLLPLSLISPAISFGQNRVVFMTINEKEFANVVSINLEQLHELAKQPGIDISKTPHLTSPAQLAIPIPSSIWEGFVVAEPEALAAALNATGLTTRSTAGGVLRATIPQGAIITKVATGSAAKVTTGVKSGTVVGGTIIAAGIVGGIIAAANNSTTTTHH
jgi:hypothetical protein